MALETLRRVKYIDGYSVIHMDDLKTQNPELFNEQGQMNAKLFEETIRPNHFIYVRHDKNSLSFTLQNGPVLENGVNGCQVDTIIHAAKRIIEGFQKTHPCRENAIVITKLTEAINWLEERTKDRMNRGVEGTDGH